MQPLRRKLLGIAALTLTMQIAGMAIAPAALCCLGGAEQVSMACCKDAGPGHICPLMKKKAQSSETDAKLQSCCSLEDQIFTALFGFVGLPAPSLASLAAPAVSPSIVASTNDAFDWLAPVESPPPRA